MRDLVIVGSGPAGLSAAVYAKRAMMDVVVLEKEAFSGGQIVNTEQVDNYLGMPGISGFDMGMKFREHADTFDVEFDDREVTAIEDHGDHKKVCLEDGSTESLAFPVRRNSQGQEFLTVLHVMEHFLGTKKSQLWAEAT